VTTHQRRRGLTARRGILVDHRQPGDLFHVAQNRLFGNCA
jgi:hypothetical protein